MAEGSSSVISYCTDLTQRAPFEPALPVLRVNRPVGRFTEKSGGHGEFVERGRGEARLRDRKSAKLRNSKTAMRQSGWGCFLPGEACLAWGVLWRLVIGRKRRRSAALHESLLGKRCCARIVWWRGAFFGNWLRSALRNAFREFLRFELITIGYRLVATWGYRFFSFAAWLGGLVRLFGRPGPGAFAAGLWGRFARRGRICLLSSRS